MLLGQLWTFSGTESETILRSASDANVSYQWTQENTLQSVKNNTLFLAVTGNEVHEETKGLFKI